MGRPAPPRRFLDAGLRLIVDGLAQSLPRSVAGVLSIDEAGSVELLTLATSHQDGASDATVDDVVAHARGNASGPVTTDVGPRHSHLPLLDRVGTPCGLLFVATEDPATQLTAVWAHALVTAYAAQAESELRGAVERQRLGDRARLAETARQVGRQAVSQLDPVEAFAKIEQALLTGFRADAVRMRSYSATLTSGAPMSTPTYTPSAAPTGTLEPAAAGRAFALSRKMSRRLWTQGRVAVISDHAAPRDLLAADELDELRGLLRRLGLASMLLVPVGFGATSTGHLALGRKDPEQPWTPEEAQVATEIGVDLGRAVHNAEAFAHDQRLAADLRALGLAKSRLIGNVSHELRGPLTTVIGHLELLGSAPGLSEEARQCVEAMDRNGNRLHRMVEDLTLLARVGDPAAIARCEPVDVGLVAREVVDMIEVTAERAGIEVRLALASEPPAVLGDRTEIDQALCNLLSNAIKYGQRGGHVELRLDVVDGDAVISCCDDGLGISDEDLPRLFTEFFRSSNPAALKRPGTGLGLVIVDQVARRHGGRVEVSSELGRGSEFRLYLPAMPGVSTGSTGSTGAAGAARLGRSGRSGRSVAAEPASG